MTVSVPLVLEAYFLRLQVLVVLGKPGLWLQSSLDYNEINPNLFTSLKLAQFRSSLAKFAKNSHVHLSSRSKRPQVNSSEVSLPFESMRSSQLDFSSFFFVKTSAKTSFKELPMTVSVPLVLEAYFLWLQLLVVLGKPRQVPHFEVCDERTHLVLLVCNNSYSLAREVKPCSAWCSGFTTWYVSPSCQVVSRFESAVWGKIQYNDVLF